MPVMRDISYMLRALSAFSNVLGSCYPVRALALQEREAHSVGSDKVQKDVSA